MKTLIILLLTFTFLLLTSPVSAQTASLSAIPAIEIGDSLIDPTSPFYFLKTIRERIEQTLQLSDHSKTIGQVEFAHRRLREVNSLVNNKRQDLIEVTLEKYRHHGELAFKKSAENFNLGLDVAEGLSSQIDVLVRIYDQIGDPNGKRAIRASVIRLEENMDKFLGQRSEIDLRQTQACQFLMKVSEDGSLNEPERAILKQKVTQCVIPDLIRDPR